MDQNQMTESRPTSSHDQERMHEPEKKPGPSESKPAGPPWYRRPLLMGGLFLAVIVVVVVGTLWWLHSRHYESTDDAFVDILPQQVSAQVAGRVTRVLVRDNQEVAVGDLLVELDSADWRTKLAQADAAVAQAKAQLAQAVAQRGLFAAQAEAARANLGVAETNADNAAQYLRRFEGLRRDDPGAVSQQQWDNAVAAQKTSAAQVEAAKKSVTAAEAQVTYADSLAEAARAAQRGADAQVEQANLNISYTQVRALVAGRASHIQVATGNFVQPGAALMAVVPRDVYVTANFKETQLAEMRNGQPVELTVDAYPDFKLTGHVDSVQAGTGQSFSALPAENATGNWVKVVQRVPVKIALDQIPDDPLRRLGPGMSAEVKVKIR
jgi:membrane fusion protein (multidrug efflux system)